MTRNTRVIRSPHPRKSRSQRAVDDELGGIIPDQLQVRIHLIHRAREEAAKVPTVDKIVSHAVEAILGDGDETALDVIERHYDPLSEEANDLARMAVLQAQRDPRYYGIEDPETERYCYSCRKVKGTEHFNVRSGECDDCYETRQEKGW